MSDKKFLHDMDKVTVGFSSTLAVPSHLVPQLVDILRQSYLETGYNKTKKLKTPRVEVDNIGEMCNVPFEDESNQKPVPMSDTESMPEDF